MTLRGVTTSLLLVITAGFVSPSLAVMEALSIKTLVQASDSVVRGTVEETTAQWNHSHTKIVTRATINISKDYKGIVTEKKLIVEYLGGEVDDLVFMVSDSVKMVVGEEVILFLERDDQSTHGAIYDIVGSAQGKYSMDMNGKGSTGRFSLMNEDGSVYRELSENDLIQKIMDALE